MRRSAAEEPLSGSAAATLVLVTTSFPIHGDGSEAAGSFVADLVEELSRSVRVHVVAPGPDASRSQWSNRVEVFRYAAPSQPLSTLKPWKPRDFCWIIGVLRGGLVATRLASVPGTIHLLALWGLPCGEWARRTAIDKGLSYSVWMLGSDVWSLGRKPILRQMLGRVIRNAKEAYADGYGLADDARSISGTKVQFLPSTRRVDLSRSVPPRVGAPYRLLFLGRWHPNKGVDLLLDALDLLTDEDWRHIQSVEVQGGGPLESLVRQRTADLQMRKRPVTAGRFLAKAEAESAIARADWLLIPSRIESIPVVFSDAMKFGRPVLAMPVGDLPRLLSGKSLGCGVVCAEVTAESFADGIRAVVRGQVQIKVDALRELACTFSLSSIAQRLLIAFCPEPDSE